jgi:ubiquinone/menaquinone biosynthesis C-methylase UbiE
MSHLADSTDLQEILEEERQFHNRFYGRVTPFELGSFDFTKEQVWHFLDNSWKKGRSFEGRRNRRYLELMDLENIAGKKVLDVGCGNGQFSVFFAMYGAEVWGIDLSDVGIEVARKSAALNGVAEHCHFIVGDATATDFPDGFFDCITFSAALHHAVKYPGMREETWRVLKPGGVLVFSDILRDNKFYNACKAVYLHFRPQTDSGVNITMADYNAFWHGYEPPHIERLSLLEGWKHFLPRKLVLSAPGRALLYVTSKLDDGLLHVVPGLGRYCLEIVGTVRKPVNAVAETPNLEQG